MYGRDVHGPLDVLKEEWIHARHCPDDVLTYVTTVRERLEATRELVQENMRKAQAKQKLWYDKKARELQLKEGDP